MMSAPCAGSAVWASSVLLLDCSSIRAVRKLCRMLRSVFSTLCGHTKMSSSSKTRSQELLQLRLIWHTSLRLNRDFCLGCSLVILKTCHVRIMVSVNNYGHNLRDGPVFYTWHLYLPSKAKMLTGVHSFFLFFFLFWGGGEEDGALLPLLTIHQHDNQQHLTSKVSVCITWLIMFCCALYGHANNQTYLSL